MLSKFKHRSYDAELMDDFSIGGEELDQTLAELRLVNRYLGGLSATLAALAPELRKNLARSYRILDIGTGSADIPEGIARWARTHHIQVEIIAMDINPYTCAYARHRVADFPEIKVVAADVFHLPFPDGAFDYTHAAMTLHHFTQEECVELLKIMHAKATHGLIVRPRTSRIQPSARRSPWRLGRAEGVQRLADARDLGLGGRSAADHGDDQLA